MSRKPYGLPAEPLLALIRTRSAEAGMGRKEFILDRFGPNIERYFWRWNQGMGVTIPLADKIACTLGVHPGDLWSEWWDVEHLDDDHGTLLSYQDGCVCVPCLRAGLAALTERMWAMSPLTTEQLEVVHAGGEPDDPGLHLVAPLDDVAGAYPSEDAAA